MSHRVSFRDIGEQVRVLEVLPARADGDRNSYVGRVGTLLSSHSAYGEIHPEIYVVDFPDGSQVPATKVELTSARVATGR